MSHVIRPQLRADKIIFSSLYSSLVVDWRSVRRFQLWWLLSSFCVRWEWLFFSPSSTLNSIIMKFRQSLQARLLISANLIRGSTHTESRTVVKGKVHLQFRVAGVLLIRFQFVLFANEMAAGRMKQSVMKLPFWLAETFSHFHFTLTTAISSLFAENSAK